MPHSRRLLGLIIVLALCVPLTATADTARVRGLAGGDARLLPDDDGTIVFFPNRLEEHQRILFQNVAPDGGFDEEDPVSTTENAESWGELSWEWLGGTAQVGLNRPTSSVVTQRFYEAIVGSSGTPTARSLIDFGFARNGWGVLTNIGISAVENERSNWFGELTFGRALEALEIAGGFAVNEINNITVIDVSLDGRTSRDGFFNHSVFGVAYSNTDPGGGGDSLNEVTVDGTTFHYGQGDLGNEKLTTLVAVGASFTNLSGGGQSASLLLGPTITGGGEYAATSWLDLRGNVSRSFLFTFGDVTAAAIGGETVATMGATGHWGQLYINAVVQNTFFESGPDFIGGNTSGISNFVSVGYALN